MNTIAESSNVSSTYADMQKAIRINAEGFFVNGFDHLPLLY